MQLLLHGIYGSHRYGPEAYVAYSGWLEQKGIVHTPSQLALLQLSPCCIRNALWLASSVKALSSLNATQKGLGIDLARTSCNPPLEQPFAHGL